jgi:hypothetical protein
VIFVWLKLVAEMPYFVKNKPLFDICRCSFSLSLRKNNAVEDMYIDFRNVERLVQLEAQRKKAHWERKSKNLLVVIAALVMILLFL